VLAKRRAFEDRRGMKGMKNKATRRRFVRNAGIWAAAGVAFPRALAAREKAAETCGLAMGTYGMPEMTLDESIELIAETGFDALEITVFEGTSGDPEGALRAPARRREVSKIVAESGLRLTALMADVRPSAEDAEHRRSIDQLQRLIGLARALAPEAPPLIQTTLGGREWETSRELFRDRLADWLQILADQKVDLAIKPHRGNAMSTPAEASWLLGQLGFARRLGMVYDYSHYAFRGAELSIAATVGEALPTVRYVAVKDAVEGEDGRIRFALPGEGGAWDHAEIVSALHAGGYRGDFCCEVSAQVWRAEGYDAVAATRASYAHLADAFERAGVARA